MKDIDNMSELELTELIEKINELADKNNIQHIFASITDPLIDELTELRKDYNQFRNEVSDITNNLIKLLP